jgi:lysozyme
MSEDIIVNAPKHWLRDPGFALIRSFEGCARKLDDGRFAAYPDPGSADGRPYTIGWGSTGSDIHPGTIWTQAQCDDRFETELGKYVQQVREAIGNTPTTENQFDALVSFHYNTGQIRHATLTRKHVAGDCAGAAAEFAKWTYNDGRVMKGLVKRRAAERALYERPDA